MSDPMADEQLAAIRARAEAATPGPWYGELGEVFSNDGNFVWIPNSDYDDRADVTFIAHARQDIPALLAEVERLRPFEAQALAQRIQILQWESRVTTIESAMAEHERSVPKIVAFNDHVVAEVERFRAENEAMREVVQAVADATTPDDWFCEYCRTPCRQIGMYFEMVHAPNCIVPKAREIVKQYQPPS